MTRAHGGKTRSAPLHRAQSRRGTAVAGACLLLANRAGPTVAGVPVAHSTESGDGGIFAFGAARFHGGVSTEQAVAPVAVIMHN